MRVMKIFILSALVLIVHCQKIGRLFSGSQTISIYSGNREIQNPAALKMQDGSWMVVFSNDTNRPDAEGELLMTRSKNINGPWSKPESILKSTVPCLYPQIAQLKNGMIWIQFETGALKKNDGWHATGTAFIRSYDYGDRFSVPHMIYLSGLRSWHALHSVFESSDGKWMLPVVYTSDEGISQAGLTVSDNEGESWSDITPISLIGPDMNVKNFNLTRLEDGRLLAIMQLESQDMICKSLSDLDYISWSEPETTNLYGTQPDILQRQSGTVLCWFQDQSPPGFSVMQSYDFGHTFEHEIPLDLGKETSIPTLVEEDNHEIAMFYVQSNDIFIKMLKMDTMPVVSGLSIVPDSVSSALRWNPVKTAYYYRIYRGLGPDSLVQDLSFLGTAIHTNFTDSLVQTGETYTYQVSAVQGSGKLYPNSGSEGPPSKRVECSIPKN